MTLDPNSGDPKNKPDPRTIERARDFLSMFHRGAEFLREVVEDNEKLRFRIASLEEELKNKIADATGKEQIERLSREVEAWRAKYSALLARIDEVEQENKDFLQRYVEVEEENNNLANLYIASYQLHSTLNFKEVLQIIVEIVINLIGAEIFAVYLLDQKDRTLHAVASEGRDIGAFPNVPLGSGEIGSAVAEARLALFEDRLGERTGLIDRPLAVIPLQIKNDPIGAIVVYQLLQQKSRFQDVDRELFQLLAGHAATAIFASKLYSESERKLNTMQGFIELLTK